MLSIRSNRLTSRVRLLAFATLLTALVLRAQNTAGSISGVVQDAQGAVIPGAKVTLTNQAQGAVSRELPTSSEGSFVFTPVLPGTYQVSVEAAGFKKYVQSGIALDVNDKLGLPPIKLEVGATGESVTVEAEAVQLQTVTAERSGVVTGRQMVDLALNGRNLTGLLKTVEGANIDTNNFNGQRTDQMNFTVDGQTFIDSGVNALTVQRINVDAIAEFKVSSNSQGAEFGRNSGAQVQVVTRSGTRDFHGVGYWFKRGEFMNANTFINNANGVQRQIYRYLTAGYNFSGPIFIPHKFNTDRSKLFFFRANEWNRSKVPGTLQQLTVPTALQRQGDLSQTRDAAGVPVIIRDPLTNAPFPGNMIPASRFNQYGQAVLNLLPMPNLPGNPAFNYTSQIYLQRPAVRPGLQSGLQPERKVAILRPRHYEQIDHSYTLWHAGFTKRARADASYQSHGRLGLYHQCLDHHQSHLHQRVPLRTDSELHSGRSSTFGQPLLH